MTGDPDRGRSTQLAGQPLSHGAFVELVDHHGQPGMVQLTGRSSRCGQHLEVGADELVEGDVHQVAAVDPEHRVGVVAVWLVGDVGQSVDQVAEGRTLAHTRFAQQHQRIPAIDSVSIASLPAQRCGGC
jgi:hypothetical protein